MQCEQREAFLLVREIGQPFGLNAAPPLQIIEAFLRELPASALRFDVIALALELLMLGAERLDLNEKRSGLEKLPTPSSRLVKLVLGTKTSLGHRGPG
jgi:hypothetical protein